MKLSKIRKWSTLVDRPEKPMDRAFHKRTEAYMSRVIEVFSQATNMDKDTIETELFAAIRALEIDPSTMTVEDLRQCLLIYIDEVFYGTSPERVQ